MDRDVHYDFTGLLGLQPHQLFAELADTHTALANLHTQIAFLRQEELRGTEGAKLRRYEAEGLRDAYSEKKWLIKDLLHGV